MMHSVRIALRSLRGKHCSIVLSTDNSILCIRSATGNLNFAIATRRTLSSGVDKPLDNSEAKSTTEAKSIEVDSDDQLSPGEILLYKESQQFTIRAMLGVSFVNAMVRCVRFWIVYHT